MIELPEKPQLRVPVKVYFYDTDAGGVVHNVAYLRMIEYARSELAEYLGWPLHEMMQGVCPVVRRTEIDYLKPARMGDDLTIRAELTKMDRIRFYISFEMVRLSDNALICQATQTMVPVDLSTGRPVPLRKDWLERWPDLLEKQKEKKEEVIES